MPSPLDSFSVVAFVPLLREVKLRSSAVMTSVLLVVLIVVAVNMPVPSRSESALMSVAPLVMRSLLMVMPSSASRLRAPAPVMFVPAALKVRVLFDESVMPAAI